MWESERSFLSFKPYKTFNMIAFMIGSHYFQEKLSKNKKSWRIVVGLCVFKNFKNQEKRGVS